MTLKDIAICLGLVGAVYSFGACIDKTIEPYRQVFRGTIDHKQVTYAENIGNFFWNKHDEMLIRTRDGATFRIYEYLNDLDLSELKNCSAGKPELVKITKDGKIRTFYLGDCELDPGKPGRYSMKEAKERAELNGETKAVFNQATKTYNEFRDKIKEKLAEMSKGALNRAENATQSELEKQLK